MMDERLFSLCSKSCTLSSAFCSSICKSKQVHQQDTIVMMTPNHAFSSCRKAQLISMPCHLHATLLQRQGRLVLTSEKLLSQVNRQLHKVVLHWESTDSRLCQPWLQHKESLVMMGLLQYATEDCRHSSSLASCLAPCLILEHTGCNAGKA